MNVKKAIRISFLICTLSFFTVTCKKNNIGQAEPEKPLEEQVDLSAKVTASVSGFVTNESDATINGANVQYGASTTTTNKYGYFEIKDATVTEKAAFVTINMAGYFKGIKTFIAEAGKENFCRIKLIPKTITGTIDAASGGNVSLANGLNISFSANGIMDAATKTPYTGTVNVSSFWIDPTGNDLNKLMPGDLRGINENNSLKGLTTFGMAAVELTGNAGELLQIAKGKKVSLTMPIPASILANAPATIPLWYFDETLGLWKEEGSATKEGNVYTGDVKHFSFWNCDMPNISMVQFNCTLTDISNIPIAGMEVKITEVNNPTNSRYEYTNGNGYVSGSIPANTQYLLDVLDNGCTFFSKNFSSASLAFSLDTVKLSAIDLVTISGTVTDCNTNPVTNGYVILKKGPNNYFCGLSASSYSFLIPVGCALTTISLNAVNAYTGEESLANSYTITHQNTNLPNIVACGQTNNEYANLTINDESYILRSVGSSGSGPINSGSWYTGNPPFTWFDNIMLLKLKNGVYIQNSDKVVLDISHAQTPPGLNNLNNIIDLTLYRGADDGFLHSLHLEGDPTITEGVTLTEYGNPGQYITGTYNGILHKGYYPNNIDTLNPYYVTFNFRLYREY